MDLTTPAKTIIIGSHTLYLTLKNQAPVVDYRDQTYTHFYFLIDQIPELSNPLYIEAFAHISNFFWKGGQFHCIDKIADYQKYYVERVKMEKKHPADVFEYRLTDYKIFDVSVMHEPRIEGDSLIYYTYQASTGLPYRVVCPFPYTKTSTLVHYQILPIIE